MRRGLLALAALIAFVPMFWAARRAPKSAVLALSGEDIADLSARASTPIDEILERAKVIGVSAVSLKDQTIASAVEQGDILQFSRSELEKWRAMGLIASGAPVRPGSLWMKENETLARVSAAAARARMPMSTSTAGGYHAADFPPRAGSASLSLGPDPELAAAVEKAGLLVLAGSASAREMSAEDGCGEALRAAFAGPSPTLLWRFSAALDIEGNFDILRQCSGRLKSLGASLSPPAVPEQGGARRTLSWIILALGPLLAVRAGLRALSGARHFVKAALPQASPVLESAAALLATGGAASLAGLAINRLGGLPLHEPSAAWALRWALAGPLFMGGFALYAKDIPLLGRSLKNPLTAGALLKAGAVLALILLLEPGHHLTPWMKRMTSLFEALWWLPWRWREIFFGVPALVAAHVCLLRSWSCPDCGAEEDSAPSEDSGEQADSRPWLLLGLLSPAGTIAALGDCGVPFALGLGQAWAALLAGWILGGAAVAATLCLKRK